MAKNPLYGYTNRILAEITAYLLSNKDFCNFLYYTDEKYEYADLTRLDIPPSNEIYDKYFLNIRMELLHHFL